jgi:hypothetical protein
MKCRIKAGNLGELRKPIQQRTNGRKIIGLMQRRERRILLQTCKHVVVNENGPVIFWSAMDHTVTNRNKLELLVLMQPPPRHGDCGPDVWHLIPTVFPVNQNGLVIGLSAQPRPSANAIHLASHKPNQRCGAIDPEHLKFHTGRAAVYDKYCIHDTTSRG